MVSRKKEIVGRVIDLLYNRESWLVKRTAENLWREPVHECSLQACRFCLIGALVRAAFESRDDPTYADEASEKRLVKEYAEVMEDVIAKAYQLFPAPVPENDGGPESRIIAWNDAEGRSHGEVLKVLRTVRTTYDE